MDSQELGVQRRRSERVAQTLSIVIRGVDLLGQPFEERTSTLSFNLHGCRYASKHHVPKNTWVSLEIANQPELQNVRARVAWIQRPHSVREFFHVSIELENPGNIWGCEPAPLDWSEAEGGLASSVSNASSVNDVPNTDNVETAVPNTSGEVGEEFMGEMNDMAAVPESDLREARAEHSTVENPLFRELNAELEERAKRVVDEAAAAAAERVRKAADQAEQKTLWASEESFRRWRDQFEETQNSAREQLATHRGHLIAEMRSEFDEGVRRAKHLIEEIEKNREALRGEREASAEAMSRLAQSRLEYEALEAARPSQSSAEGAKVATSFSEEAAADWRQQLQSAMHVARTQWDELLQSSLDSGVHRISEKLSDRSQELGRTAELELSGRFEGLRQPLLQALDEALKTASAIQTALDQELAKAKTSLAEIEQSALKTTERAAQAGSSAQEAVAALNQRLQGILDAQAQEMCERAQNINDTAAEKAASALEALKQTVVERTAVETESRIAPQIERVAQVLREVSNREVQLEESLRLHRERVRQVSENSERELIAYFGAAAGEVRKEFDTAREQAIAKWNAELNASGVRASHVVAESIEKTTQSYEHDARARLQTLIEQTVASAGNNLDEKMAEAKQSFATALEAESSGRVASIRQQLENFSSELTATGRTQIEQAAEVTAAAFGQVLRGISDQEVERFSSASMSFVQGRTLDLENSAAHFLRNFETGAESSLARFQAQMSSQLEANIAMGRDQLATEFNSVLAGYRSEREVHQKDWFEHLARLSDEAAGHHQERLDTASDSWVVSSVRRLNEHGQNVIESLMRSADQALRDSCARFFDGLAETLRDRSVAFAAPRQIANETHEAAEAAPPPPPTESDLHQANL